MTEAVLNAIRRAEELYWVNPHYSPETIRKQTDPEVEEARARLERFRPFLSKAFPETLANEGRIESPLTEVPHLKGVLSQRTPIQGRLFLKRDSDLPISGSIKARGGIYEVLHYAETIAANELGLTPDDDYSLFLTPTYQKHMSGYRVSVGSTGNLGLSIGIMSRALGFGVTVHMSADARPWKKEKLRSVGAEVIEYESDYEAAVANGRRLAEADPKTHFVDDEHSMDLFLGYAVAGERLKNQLDSLRIVVDEKHPLFVYLPCGVGGGPGGVAYGIQNALGEHAHCLFAEPVQAPCMLLSILTQTHGELSVKDIGLSGRTEADGLAVGRASALVSRAMTPRLDALYTVEDAKLLPYIRALHDAEDLFIEPSAAATFDGPGYVESSGRYGEEALKNATHVLWATGGQMVPPAERDEFLGK